MDLRALRYFVHIAELRSFSKAAVQLRVAQPALSRQVRKLEDELGVELLERAGRQIALTEAGALLLQRAHSLIRQVSQAADEVRSNGADLVGSATLGVSPATCEVLGPIITRMCAERYPKLRLNFIEGFSGFILDRLIQDELTLCILHNPPRHRGVEIEPLLSEPMYLVGPPSKASALPRARAKAALDSLPLILPNRTHSLRLLIDRALAGRRIDVALQVDGYTLTKALVAAGQGYTILPYSAVHQQVEAKQLSAVPIRPQISWTLSLAYRTDQRTTRTVGTLRAIIRAGMKLLIAEGKWRGEQRAARRLGQQHRSRELERPPIEKEAQNFPPARG
jgi:LysR family transcriptional regulator, nitrogen assimilation regulatory protein